jgi:Protein of unknown function (DUF3047)
MGIEVVGRLVRRMLALACGVALGACQTSPEVEPRGVSSPSWTDEWHAFELPGKRSTRYVPVQFDSQWVLHAHADRSASVHRRTVRVAPDELGSVSFSWKVASLVPGADVRENDVEDAPVRLLLAFDGDTKRLSPRTRVMFDLMHTLTGEAPPFATLMYVWDGSTPVDTLVVNRRSDRVRKIVLESGPAHLGQWRNYTRDIAVDFRRAFGEEPGTLIGIAVMTDTDNTQTSAEAWYGEIKLLSVSGGVVW